MMKLFEIFIQFSEKKNEFKKLNFISKNYLTNQKTCTIMMSTTKKEKRKQKTHNLKRGGDSSGKQRNHIIQNLIHYSISSEWEGE